MSNKVGHPVPIVARTMWQSLSRYLLMMLLIFVVIYVVIAVIIAATGKVTTSTVEIAGAGGPKYVLFSYGLIMLVTLMPVYAAFGVTRRHFMTATVVFGTAVSLMAAVILVVAYVVERTVYQASGVLAGMPSYPLRTWADLVPLLVQIWLVFLAHLVSAWLIALGYWRTGPTWGTLLLPLAVIPAIATEAVFGAKWIGTGVDALLRVSPAPWPWATVISVALCAAGIAVAYAAIRTVPIGVAQRIVKF
ncbi:hypothetical protein [Fodinicola feengrottensis]|uniref:ABC transporter permease n=1 Tax=Fodinicola feengrottensis TaxID=435914 RepID=A0ABN2GND7_9ACTN|nr:hypothetical protein [Fodinicola feengrottensis]